MSTLTTIGTVNAALDSERAHKTRVVIAYALAALLLIGIAAYGFDYYFASAADRPYSHKHQLLKPSGAIGIKFGVLGTVLFCGLFFHPIRKRVAWLNKIGSSRHWLDFHVVLGLTAPLVIAFHSSFKFHGIAGMAFWIMSAVALSGVIGRYIYAQIPRRLNSAEMTLQELQIEQEQLSSEIARQFLVTPDDFERLFRMPTRDQVARYPAAMALLWMVAIDFARPFAMAHLRRHVMHGAALIFTLGGLLPSRNAELERVVGIARHRATLGKKILFLGRAQEVFHLWHVVHRPFSYSFVVLATIHIAVVLSLGYM